MTNEFAQAVVSWLARPELKSLRLFNNGDTWTLRWAVEEPRYEEYVDPADYFRKKPKGPPVTVFGVTHYQVHSGGFYDLMRSAMERETEPGWGSKGKAIEEDD